MAYANRRRIKVRIRGKEFSSMSNAAAYYGCSMALISRLIQDGQDALDSYDFDVRKRRRGSSYGAGLITADPALRNDPNSEYYVPPETILEPSAQSSGRQTIYPSGRARSADSNSVKRSKIRTNNPPEYMAVIYPAKTKSNPNPVIKYLAFDGQNTTSDINFAWIGSKNQFKTLKLISKKAKQAKLEKRTVATDQKLQAQREELKKAMVS